MTSFDPYHVWLGIPPAEQPPSHYRLLAIAPLEDSPDVIENAADRQMAHVRRAATGKHADASQKILNEIASARRCLLDREQKAQYDARLRKEQSPAPGGIEATMEWKPAKPPKPPAKPPPPRTKSDEPPQRWKGGPADVDTIAPPPTPTVTIATSESTSVSRARRRAGRPMWLLALVAGLALLPVLALVAALAVMAQQSSVAEVDDDPGDSQPAPPFTTISDKSTSSPLPSPGEVGSGRLQPATGQDRMNLVTTSESGDDGAAFTKTITVSAKKPMIQLGLFRLPAHAATGVFLDAGQVVKLRVSGQYRIGFQAHDIRGPDGLLVAIGSTDAPATQFFKGTPEMDFTVDKSGQLFLAVDDLIAADNQGELTVEVAVYD